MDVKRLTVGPIVGHTTADYTRIFGRADLSIYDDRPRKAHGVIRHRKAGDENYHAPQYFKMNPNFDLTGVIVVKDLEESTDYEYQVGWFFSDVDTKEIDVKKILNWNNIDTYRFKTASADNKLARTIAFGSCRYVLRLFGGYWWDDRGDTTFRSILEHVDKQASIDQVIMCGDQIYADDLNCLGADDALDEFNTRYRKVFTTPYMRKLMARIPTYMTLDDHEIEDNWPESASRKDWVFKFPAAIHAYSTYQASHSPLFALNGSRIAGSPTHLWYSYSDGCCDVFVTDTRTERSVEGENPEIIGPNQLQSLLEWLDDGSGRVKIIVSSVPPYESESDDKWHGYISQRDELLEWIRIKQISKVVFLSGDVHASMSSQLELDETTRLTSIVSSAFFWPYPHPFRRSFKLTGNIPSLTQTNYKVVKASKVFPTDAFTKLHISTDAINIEFCSRKGKVLGTKKYSF